jgi:hypothetical protein
LVRNKAVLGQGLKQIIPFSYFFFFFSFFAAGQIAKTKSDAAMLKKLLNGKK